MIRVDTGKQALELSCRQCGAVNRVPLRRLEEGPVCGRCGSAVRPAEPLVVTDATFETVIGQTTLPVLVDFWAPWCGPCRVVAPELEKVAQQKQGELLVAKLDSDENPQSASRYGIRAIPTMILFSGGQEAKRLQGAMRAPQILAEVGV
jgi:thioredoxin 2